MKKSWLILFIVLLTACSQENHRKTMRDKHIREIISLQDMGDTKMLIPYLNHKKSKCRARAALAFGTLRDTAAINPLSLLLKDRNTLVRKHAAFALGQLKSPICARPLREAIKNEKKAAVLDELYNALGKTGDEEDLQKLTTLKTSPLNTEKTTRLCRAFFNFSKRRIFNTQALQKCISFLSADYHPDTRKYAAYTLLYANHYSIDQDKEKILEIIEKEKNPEILSLIIRLLSKEPDRESLNCILSHLEPDNHVVVRISAINTLRNFDYSDIKESLLHCLNDSSAKVSGEASRYFIYWGKKADASEYFEWACKSEHWEAAANMYRAATKHGDNKTYYKHIKDVFHNSNNKYFRSSLLPAIGESCDNFMFLDSVSKNCDSPLNQLALEELYQLLLKPCKNKYPIQFFSSRTAFNHYMIKNVKDNLLSADVVKVSLAATIIRNKKEIFTPDVFQDNTLDSALAKLKMPRDIEAIRELGRTISYIHNTESSLCFSNPENNPIDFDYLEKINPKQKVRLETTKGSILIELFPYYAPGQVINFCKLTESGFFDGKIFHRVIPNHVIQTGCTRGDGWGSLDYNIRSTVIPAKIESGYLAMASIGKDTESSQWYITLMPKPHYEGRSSFFGKVINGLDVARDISIGDKIISARIISY